MDVILLNLLFVGLSIRPCQVRFKPLYLYMHVHSYNIIVVGQKSSGTLMPSTIGVIIGRIGDPVVNGTGHPNFFNHEMDSIVVDPATNKPIYSAQKPVSLYKEVIELYSLPGDWILNGPDNAGQC